MRSEATGQHASDIVEASQQDESKKRKNGKGNDRAHHITGFTGQNRDL